MPYRDGTTIYHMPGTSLTAHIISVNPLNNTVGNTLISQIRRLRFRDQARDAQLRFEPSSIYCKLTFLTVTFAVSFTYSLGHQNSDLLLTPYLSKPFCRVR